MEEPLTEISVQATETESQESEVTQPMKVYQAQVFEPMQDNTNIKDQSEEDLQEEEVFEAVEHLDDHLVNTHQHLSSTSISGSKDHDERPKTVLYKLYCAISSKTLEYISESPDLKFVEFDEVARDFTSSTEVTELLDQEEVEEFLRGIAPRISATQIADIFPVTRLHELS